MKKFLFVPVIALLLVAGTASAQTMTSANTQVEALLVQIQALQAQIQALKAAQMQVATTASSVSDTLKLIRNLKQGMSGDDVAALQAALAADPAIYPQGIISGYYGSLTAEAIKKFQNKHGFEQVGFVGPKTLKKLNEVIKELGLSQEIDENATSTSNTGDSKGKGKALKLCANVPPGHLIAPGWLKKNGNNRPDISECETLPKGIGDKIGGGWGNGTTTQDTTAPVISGVGTVNLLGTTTSIVWTTNENSNSKVWYGTSSPVSTGGASHITDTGFVKSHSVLISGLATSTIYYYVVGSTDGVNNTATSSQSSFVTTAGL